MITVMTSHIQGIACCLAMLLLVAYVTVDNRQLTRRTRAFLADNFAALSDVSGEITSNSLCKAGENPAFRSFSEVIAYAYEHMHKFGHNTGATEWVSESNELGTFGRERAAYAVGPGDLGLRI